jgi:UDP-glucuronate 4-epimerase
LVKYFSNYQTILVTGCAGFIGSKNTELLLKRGDTVVGVDNLNDATKVRASVKRIEQCIEVYITC